MFQDIIHTLNSFGLNNKDARIYLFCLSVREGVYVHEIVKNTKVKRSTVDLALKRLIDSGYVNTSKVGARYKYFAESPAQIAMKQEQRTQDFKALIPFLERLQSGSSDTRVSFFEGVEGVRRLLVDQHLVHLKMAKPPKDEQLHIASGEDVLKLMPDLKTHYVNKRIRNQTAIRIIAPQTSAGPMYDTDEKALRITRYFDSAQFPFRVSIDIFGDCVSLYSPIKPVGGVMIENERIASSMRSLFELLWGFLPQD